MLNVICTEVMTMELLNHDKDKTARMRVFAIWLLILSVTAMLMSSVYTVATNIEKNNIKNDISSSIDIMKDVCQKYDDYSLSISTKNMQLIINKVNVLAQYTEDIDLSSRDELLKYAEIQYLTGIFVLDGAMDTVSSADVEDKGRTYLLKRIIADGAPNSVYKYPKKVYAGDITVDSLRYAYAVRARSDAPGVIICYKDTTAIYSDKDEFSLNTLLPADIFGEGAVFVVTDGSKVICSNNKKLENIRTADAPITDIIESDRMKDDKDLIKLQTEDGSEWYGMHDKCRDYFIYIFYPDSAVFADRRGVMAAAFGVYALCGMVLVLIIQRARRKKLLQIEKEYHLVNALASIYATNLLIRIKENRYIDILKSDMVDEAIKGVTEADRAVDLLTEKIVAEGYREEFRRFADIKTIAERLKGKPFIGFTFEDIEGKWMQALLIPQNRDPDDEVTSVMLVTRDVSEQKKREMEYQEKLRKTAERANRANEAKTDFLRRMNHDIRTPVNGIVGMIEINSKTDDQAVIKENREKAKKAAYHLLSLVNDVLEMSKLEDGVVPVEHEVFNIQKLAGDILVVAGMRAAEHSIILKHEECTESFEYPYVYGSPLRVRQIFLNIINNAIKYNKPGGNIMCSIVRDSVDEAAHTVSYKCVITDTGIGMSEEYLEHIFEPFSQEKSGARTVYRGTGLGMSIVKTLVDQMNGTIEVKSEVNIGTSVTVTIPFDIADSACAECDDIDYTADVQEINGRSVQDDTDHDVITSMNINASNVQPDISGMNIIVAEDNELNMEIVKYILEDAGASVHPSYNGAQAVEAFSSAPPGTYDVILMDIMMPVMDGCEAARSIRDMTRPDAADIPVIAMTANAFDDDRRKSLEAGMNEHITKPIDREKMITVIAECRKK